LFLPEEKSSFSKIPCSNEMDHPFENVEVQLYNLPPKDDACPKGDHSQEPKQIDRSNILPDLKQITFYLLSIKKKTFFNNEILNEINYFSILMFNHKKLGFENPFQTQID